MKIINQIEKSDKRVMLIAEDVEINRALLGKMFSDEFIIEEAENGEIALSKLRSLQRVDILLLDIRMPVMDGFEVLAEMKRDSTLSDIPVIVATANDDEAAQIKAFDLGAEDVFFKPYNRPLLVSRVHNVLSKAISAALKARIEHQAELLRLSRYDTLTGLYNRDAFCSLAAEMISGKPSGHYVVSCFDVDNFKVINEQYGLETGDFVLKEISTALRDYVDSYSDGAACRMSADNYAAILPATAGSFDDIFTEKQNELLSREGMHLNLHISAGCYVINDRSLTVSAMIDRAMLAKRSIKGRYDADVAYFDENMLKHVMAEQDVISKMEKALANGDFEPWLQPQFNHATGELCGAEALVRWIQSDGKPLYPNTFITIFERNGFIYELDKYIWESVCKLIRSWLDKGREPVPISVNISRYDIFHHDFLDFITSLIAKYDIPIELLRLEITESAFAESTGLLTDMVKRLRDFGFIVEIDDFGSGYSSFNILKDVPADVLKLDMCFLDDKTGSSRGGSILESVVRMTKWLGMLVIAEGVETKQQADYLESIGCYIVQGNYYAKAMPVGECEELIFGSKKDFSTNTLETVAGLDTDSFWDPKSIDTLVFNNYVGGACVLEFSGDKCEIVRINGKYLDAIRSKHTVAEALTYDPLESLSPEDATLLRQQVEQSAQSGDEFHGEVWKTIKRDDPPHVEYIRYVGRVIAKTRNRRMVYLLIDNITGQKSVEQREQVLTEQLRSIMASVSCGICAYGVEGPVSHIVFANDRYYSLFGYTREQFEAEVTNTFDYIYPDDRGTIMRMAFDILSSGKPITHEYRCVKRDGSVIWVRCFATTANIPGQREPVLLTETIDVTAEIMLRQKEREATEQLRASAEQLRFLNLMAKQLLAISDSEQAIVGVLSDVLKYFGGTRAYIFEMSDDGGCFCNTYEVCAKGVTAQIDNLQNIPVADAPYWMEAFNKSNHVLIESTAKLDDARMREREILEAQDINSLVAVPLRRDGEFIGFVGVDDPMQKATHVDHLGAIGDYMAVMLTRRDYERKLSSDRKTLTQLLNDMPGGYVQMRLMPDDEVVPVFINDGFCRMVGMTHDEVFELYGKSCYNGVHPDDVEKIRNVVKALINTGNPCWVRYRLITKSGLYMYVSIFGNISLKDDGGTYLNVFYMDTTEQMAEEDRRRDLLDNLPCGAAIYEIEDNNVRVGYLNQRFRELVARDDDEIRITGSISSVHPDDRAGLMNAVDEIIRTGNTMEYIVRLVNGSGGYTAFRAIGHAAVHANGSATVYATYFPINEEKRLARQMLADAVKNIPAGIGIYELRGDDVYPLYTSDNACRIFGYSTEQYEYAIANNLPLNPLNQLKAQLPVEQIKTPGESYEGVHHMVRSDNSYLWVRLNTITKSDKNGNTFIYCTIFDVTETMIAEKHSRLQTERYLMLANILEPILCDYDVETDTMAIVRYHSDGTTSEECLYDIQKNGSSFDWVDEESRPDCQKAFAKLLSSSYRGSNVYRADYGGGMRWYRAQYSSLTDETGCVYRVIFMSEDINKEQLDHLRLLEKAEIDPVTGLMNRASADEILRVQLSYNKRSGVDALLMIDIDNFKSVNDRFGHPEGDRALRMFSNALKGNFRNTDTISRYGGDEFLVYMPSCSDAQIAIKKATRLLSILPGIELPDGSGLGCSIGIVMIPKDHTDMETLLRQADYALYLSKHNGKFTFTMFDPESMSGKVSDLGNWRQRD